jgi:hypothetical protein
MPHNLTPLNFLLIGLSYLFLIDLLAIAVHQDPSVILTITAPSATVLGYSAFRLNGVEH